MGFISQFPWSNIPSIKPQRLPPKLVKNSSPSKAKGERKPRNSRRNHETKGSVAVSPQRAVAQGHPRHGKAARSCCHQGWEVSSERQPSPRAVSTCGMSLRRHMSPSRGGSGREPWGLSRAGDPAGEETPDTLFCMA